MHKLSPYYSEKELESIGFKSIGRNVHISRNSSLYQPENMEIGNNVRIDDFCILTGNIQLGSYIHISAHSSLFGKGGIQMEDYTGLSPYTAIFSTSDDFSGDYMIGPMVEHEFTNVDEGPVILEKFVQIGAKSMILPNIIIGKGSVVGAMSLVKKNLGEWGIFAGIPVVFVKKRNKNMLELETRRNK